MRELIELSSSAPVVLAYLDPGSGSLMFQVLIAGLMSGVFFARTWTGAVVRALARSPRNG
jgi:hypothetical protein